MRPNTKEVFSSKLHIMSKYICTYGKNGRNPYVLVERIEEILTLLRIYRFEVTWKK